MFAPARTLTFDTAKSVLEAGLGAIATGQQVIDLAQVERVDSSAVAVLLAWQRAARERGVPLRFSNPSVSLSSLANLYGVADLLQAGIDADHSIAVPHH
ncbi:STAS domain-containing protein [Actimicrobium sp. CCC2.4]|uniref:STAS domain-containing protein n=1 Tax=Actimicrobium sp. CCC2.4 TaxID=3048606 RepID=UPI002AC8C7FC|nr:STAS domain-containing protein [Actimicrobium sp. CCC2.4]MEB0135499.1 STAS domain-containing protein [Actimicrobium sp. CCC2.4]WPX32331.1 STAS domain-containing protein [Actimicrobium sp. CCC2.4]